MSKKSRRTDLKHNHQKKLLALIRAGKIPAAAGTVSQLNIYHDEWCRLLAGKGPCNCDPTVEVGWTQHPGANN